jgi:hypothetical protein
MSKKKTAENTTKKQESILNIPYSESGFESKYSRYFWLIIPILAILYYSYRKVSLGFYQDDEVAQYINMLNFWQDPWAILGNGPKPGYKIFMVIPALISYDAVLIFNSLIAATTVYMTYILIRSYKIGFAFVGALLLATQPLFVDLSFRSYSEIFTALCIVSFLILYKKEKFLYSALLLGYIFTIRQEIALLILVFAVIFSLKKKYYCAAALFVFPVVYNLLGFIKTGDIFFVLTEMRSVAGLNYKSQGLLHYFKVYIFIVGPISLSLFLLGFFGFLNDTSKIKEYFKKYAEFYIIFISIFIIQMLTMVSDGPNPGNWRYLLHISPICAFFAAVGLNNLSLQKFKSSNYLITGTFAILVLLFLSNATDGFVLLEKAEYTKIIFVGLFLILSVVLWNESRTKYLNTLGVSLIILAIVHLYFVDTKKLSPENISVKETAEYLDTIPDLKDKEKLTNHTFIMFYSNQYKENQRSFKKLDLKNLNEAPKGSIVIWESHYGYRPEFKNDVQMEVLQDTTKYKLIKQIVSSDKRFGSFIFEKL